MQGMVVTGQNRPDVAKAIDPAASNAGFKGYLKTVAQGKVVFLIDPEGSCQLGTKIPPKILNLSKTTDSSLAVVSTNQVQSQNA